MPIPERVQDTTARLLAAFCDTRVPERVRDQIRLSYRFDGNVAYLTESRLSLRRKGSWTSMDVARFRYFMSRGEWVLYWPDRNDKWHRYDGVRRWSSFNRLLKEVDDDPTGIFWG